MPPSLPPLSPRGLEVDGTSLISLVNDGSMSATFMDYAIPRADTLPFFFTEISEVPSTSNPLGLRGGGEGGTTPALGVVVNAVVHALSGLGVQHIEMPLTPNRVWQAIQNASQRKTA